MWKLPLFYPAGIIKDTKTIRSAAAVRKWSGLRFTLILPRSRKDEGFPDIARSFEQVSKVEKSIIPLSQTN